MVNSLKKSFLLSKFSGVMFFFLVSCSPDSEEMSSSFEVSVSVNGNGTVSSSQFNVESNTIISISAIPNEGYYFDRWDGLNEVIETETLNLKVTQPYVLTAIFLPIPILNESIEVYDPKKIDSLPVFMIVNGGKEAFLTVSGQLNVEAYCLAMSKVYTFGPTFRAENSNTSRHLAEFWMVEPEIAFSDLADNADLAEALLKHCLKAVLEHCQQDIDFFNERIDNTVRSRLETVVQEPFERMTYSQAIKILEASGKKFDFPVSWGRDLQSEHERFLAETHVGRPVVLLDYPKEIKAFYMRLNDDEKTVAAMDVLAPGIGEIIGGSQREERLDVLDARIPDEAMRESLWWYRDLRRYGTVPHAGFGLGFERLLNYVTGMDNIRDAIPFPRTPGHADF